MRKPFLFEVVAPFMGPCRISRERAKVDFILVINRHSVPIEVKSHLQGLEIPKGLRRFLLRYPATRSAYVVNENIQAETLLGSTKVFFVRPEEVDTIPLNV